MRALGDGGGLTLAPGDTGPEVLDMQQNMVVRGLPVPMTGIFDGGTANVLKGFQASVGLPQSGLYDPPTQSALLSKAVIAEAAPFTGTMPARKVQYDTSGSGSSLLSSIPWAWVAGIAGLGVAFWAWSKYGKKIDTMVQEPGPGRPLGRVRRSWRKWLEGPWWEEQAASIRQNVHKLPKPAAPIQGSITRAKDPAMNAPRGRGKRTEATGRVSRVPTRFRPEEVGMRADAWLKRVDAEGKPIPDAPPASYKVRVQVDPKLWNTTSYRAEQQRRADEQATREKREIQIVDRKSGRVLYNARLGRYADATTDKLIDEVAEKAKKGDCVEAVRALRFRRSLVNKPAEIERYNKAAYTVTYYCPKEAKEEIEAVAADEREIIAETQPKRVAQRVAQSSREEGGGRPGIKYTASINKNERDEIARIADELEKEGYVITGTSADEHGGHALRPVWLRPADRRKKPRGLLPGGRKSRAQPPAWLQRSKS